MKNKNNFIEIISENEKIILKITSFYTDNKQDAEDLYQETVLNLWKAFKNFKNRSKISTWIYRIALNTAVTQIRKNKKQPQQITLNEQIQEINIEKHNNLLDKLHKQIRKLNELEKALILLYLENKNYETISEITGLSETNVATRISRIKQKLKTNLK
ncbi:MAG: RNA polymerase sigma factor [Bacteroidales bacterium]|nr:RNA polymerase sigma factor [Bacteroidales bacterium]